jgi:hypothetical protein
MIVDPLGGIRCLYAEAIDLACLGSLSIRRASHVEPDEHGQWFADLALIGGPVLGPFRTRTDALDAERQWLEEFLASASQGTPS